MSKVLIFQSDLVDYRVETYNIINSHFPLDVAYNNKDKTKSCCEFNKIKLEYSKIGPFYWIKGFHKLTKQYDVVLIMADLHYPQYCLLPLLKRKIKVISWGIGFRVSYTKHFNTKRKHEFLDSITQLVLSNCDANIFYMEKAKEFWKNSRLRMDNIFVAPNTTSVASIDIKTNAKKNFLFVGTLYKGKGVDLLISSYSALMKEVKSECNLVIIGDGEERDNLKREVADLGIKDKVIFKGAIYNEQELAKEFQKAIICISPAQGGLSVPKSMGYGVPFVVREDAITGGEIYHIDNGKNGIMYNKDSDLYAIMKEAIDKPDKYFEMGANAKKYYDNYATPYHMAVGALNAIEYTINQQV